METRLHLQILPQPDDTTCGPTCLQAVYDYFGDKKDLHELISEIYQLKTGGTLAVLLANHALERGYSATIYSYNLRLFDPTWRELTPKKIREKLKLQSESTKSKKLRLASNAYRKFLAMGGKLRFRELTPGLIRKFLNKQIPILTGLSATYLYQCQREFGPNSDYDDVRGQPSGHFVILSGYHRLNKTVTVADPLHTNPLNALQYYEIEIQRVMNAILLGIVTYDANLLIIEPAPEGKFPKKKKVKKSQLAESE